MLHSKSLYFFIFIAILTPFLLKTVPKNTCLTYFDYLLINFNSECFYNEDVDLSVPEIIKKYTGNVEIYNITTSDGYILQMFRSSRKNPIGVILLQPPISAGSIVYVSNEKNSLAIELWNKGYDVWLSNHRGSHYSRQHLTLNDSDSKFWDFGFHEIAKYDLDAQFQIIQNQTNSKIIYISYSMGSTEALIYASLEPDKAETYIQDFILIAPLIVLENFTSPFKYLMAGLQPFQKYLEMGEFLTFEIIRLISSVINLTPYIVNFLTSIIMGWTPTEMDPALYPFIFAHHGRGISYQMIYHYKQIYDNATSFIMYYYGDEKNLNKYGTIKPPSYPLKNIKNSMHFIYGDQDRIATASDIKNVCENILSKKSISGIYEIPNTNHIDFFFSKNRKTKTYQTVFTILNKIQN